MRDHRWSVGPVTKNFRLQGKTVLLQSTVVQQNLVQGITRPSTSFWATAVVMAKNKDTMNRLCTDYCALSNVMVKDAHPLPHNNDILDSLLGLNCFCTLDLKSDYRLIPIWEDHRQNTAFWTSYYKLHELEEVSFGLWNGLPTFSCLMETILQDLVLESCLT